MKKCYPTEPASTGAITATAIAAGLDCAEGEICAAGTAVPTLCPPGTYSPSTGGPTASYDCTACKADYFCPNWGMKEDDLDTGTTYACPAGYECLGGAIHQSNVDDVTMRLCPKGFKCDFATLSEASTRCPENYFNPREGQAACLPCIAGFDCSGEAVEFPPACPRGYYCEDFDDSAGSTMTTSKYKCPPGTYSSEEYLTSQSQCEDCPPGKYCSGNGESSFTGLCAAGFICTGK